MQLRSCVHPSGRFVFGLHRPAYQVTNLRDEECILELGRTTTDAPVMNQRNFPAADVEAGEADPIYEIANPLPFRGTTFISRSWAVAKAEDPLSIGLPAAEAVSMHDSLAKTVGPEAAAEAFARLPMPVLLTLAATSTDPLDLVRLAEMSCELLSDPDGFPTGIRYQEKKGSLRPVIHHHDLFETVANNIHLPDPYKAIMVLKPGAQGGSEIVGQYNNGASHVYEYLRRNSYIPWGHYASNMAHDAVRYRTPDLSPTDMTGLRHLYYQRTFVRFAELLGIELPDRNRTLTEEELETLRLRIVSTLAKGAGTTPPFTTTLWGWNFGYDFSASGFRLHASHQQIHQQFALLPGTVQGWYNSTETAGPVPSYGCGDLVADFCREYRAATGKPFFACYLAAIRANERLDGRQDREQSLIVHEDDKVLLFVPKAQTSQWELQIMVKEEVGNILEADSATRAGIDRALLIAQQVLAKMGARMVTSIEFAKRLDSTDSDQRLLYALLPKLPYSMGAFSEAQLRFINGHFPEDFATACRTALARVADEK